MSTHEDRLAKQRIKRLENGNAYTLKYERTKHGKLMRIYRNMKSRIEGVQKAKFHLYRGKYLMPKDEFYVWAICSPDFHRLYAEWVESGYERRLSPSVDRKDSSVGYRDWNMEWVTHSENSRRGSVSKRTHRLESEAHSARNYVPARAA